jgi:hypothetical protein
MKKRVPVSQKKNKEARIDGSRHRKQHPETKRNGQNKGGSTLVSVPPSSSSLGGT